MIEIKVESEGFNRTYDVTEQINQALTRIKKRNGIAKICVAGSTVGLSVMRYEPGTAKDMLNSLEIVAPKDKEYEHLLTTSDNNGFAHVRSSFMGTSVLVPYKDNMVTLSNKHRIILFDFDLQTANRTIYVDV
ncbi:YjbQ family protein [Priestia megaterium]|uniref:YjbQ family protein n=1 Tax=Priestia megaterium TaxID=1404 RepID=UPI002E1E1EF8|nr:YjbQ family protein [Priestia megaterium]